MFQPTDLYAVPDRVRTDEVAEVLMRAAELIKIRGWYQGHFCDYTLPRGNRPRCAYGHILDAAFERGEQRGAQLCVAAMSALQLQVHGESIPNWNDAPERTKAQVIEALESAARARQALAERGK